MAKANVYFSFNGKTYSTRSGMLSGQRAWVDNQVKRYAAEVATSKNWKRFFAQRSAINFCHDRENSLGGVRIENRYFYEFCNRCLALANARAEQLTAQYKAERDLRNAETEQERRDRIRATRRAKIAVGGF